MERLRAKSQSDIRPRQGTLRRTENQPEPAIVSASTLEPIVATAMRNYAEELVYWYLRLNGFFPLMNFVQHAHGLESSHSADRDVLALRFPHVVEEIAGKSDHWDPNLINCLCQKLPVGLIGEVKAGKSPEVTQLIDDQRLTYSLKRLGCFADVEEAARRLHTDKSVVFENCQVIKVFFAKEASRDFSKLPILPLTLEQLEKFVRERIQKYWDVKYEAWNHFDSPLLQYFIESEKRK